MRIAQTMARAMAIVALASAGVAGASLDPLGDPTQFKQDIEALNAKPKPDGEALARAVGIAVAADAQHRNRCLSKKLTLGALEPVTLDGIITTMISKGQIENAWLLSVKLDDCPPADPIRILLVRGPDGQALQAYFAGQGESLAWPTLSREALRATVGKATEALRKNDPKCNPGDITPVGIKVTDRSPDFGPSVYGIRLRGSWRELWTFAPCDHRIEVPIAFRTNGAGGAFWDIDEPAVRFTP